MPSNHLILCHPLLLLPSIVSSIRVFSNESALRIRWPKNWSCSLSISPTNEYPGSPLGWTGWISLQPKGLSRVFTNRGRSQDGGGVGRGEHFLPYKFIKRAFKRRVNSTKQLLNAGRGHQAPRKATQLFERREKKYSSIHQNTDTSFPNQETLTSHLYKPTHSEETPQ